VPYLLIYGNGWTQRWSVSAEKEDEVRSMLVAVGSDRTGQLPVLDPGSDAEVTLFVSWSKVAAAIMLDADMPGTMDDASAGQYQ
jgi:hypothetical protein